MNRRAQTLQVVHARRYLLPSNRVRRRDKRTREGASAQKFLVVLLLLYSTPFVEGPIGQLSYDR